MGLEIRTDDEMSVASPTSTELTSISSAGNLERAPNFDKIKEHFAGINHEFLIKIKIHDASRVEDMI